MARSDKLKPLQDRQERFCLEYLKDLNATQAAVRAGYSARTAEVQGPRLLGNVRVATRVQQLLEKRNQKLELRAEDVLRELMRIANVDVSKIYDADGRLLGVHEMPEDIRRAIAGVEVATSGDDDDQIVTTKRIKFWDKPKALELLAKHLKLLTDRVEVVDGGMADALKRARVRAAGKGGAK